MKKWISVYNLDTFIVFYVIIAFVLCVAAFIIYLRGNVNSGNKYNDEKQKDKFCKSLNENRIDRILSIEGKNYGY